MEMMLQTFMDPEIEVTNQMVSEWIGNQTLIYNDCQEIIEKNDETILFLEERIENQEDSSEEEKQELTEIKYKVLEFNQDIVLVKKLSQEFRKHISNVFLNVNNQENQLDNAVIEMNNRFNDFIHLNDDTLGRQTLLHLVYQVNQYSVKVLSF